jgi:hypothetical protein
VAGAGLLLLLAVLAAGFVIATTVAPKVVDLASSTGQTIAQAAVDALSSLTPKQLPTPTAAPTITPPAPATVAPTATTRVSTPTPTAAPTPGPSRLVVANTGGDGVFIRKSPSLGDRLHAWPDDTPMQVVGEDRQVGGGIWRNVRDPAGNVGWVPAQYLAPEQAEAPKPTPAAR